MNAIKRVVIVGGGTAGWLTAGILASRHPRRDEQGISITLVESPDTPTIGVGEGTWPTLRESLERIGISEHEFIRRCDASFKQASRFDGWRNGTDSYYHPFTPPPEEQPVDLYAAWRSLDPDRSFADFVTPQVAACDRHLAPKAPGLEEYRGALNYAYHLDAGKFAEMLREHSTEKLGVTHLSAHVTSIEAADNGDIAAIETKQAGRIEGDFFIDCTGMRSLLLGDHYGVASNDVSDRLFNDRALVVQAPVEEGSPIASQTIGTAHSAGWIWDIGLPTRRGIGFVYSSRYLDEEKAAEGLDAYLKKSGSKSSLKDLKSRTIPFKSGWRERFFERNCVAIGLSAGFVEPLEASAIVTIELAASFVADHFPGDRSAMDVLARRFNRSFSYRWDRIEDFLKLHYVLSERDEPYWKDNVDPASMSDTLAGSLDFWRVSPPSLIDFPQAEEMFPAISYQFILYGMGFRSELPGSYRAINPERLIKDLKHIAQARDVFARQLPTNRKWLDDLRA
ncbi:tryptophan halogenase family protein [Sphingomicrobium clamense]|uniref:Tryptophan 7-halogenase n=1 Tax=Sphingomicrobium clamense TaxID=2851013 RepID=A0ABS6V7C2_9SPHN|nr:tryptophan halogenase family protein [Sphingomicrobium sp. B8]MBW0145469.1 tryptophan 7-halogenase [Sphingomicrobium sp. B8]